MVTANTTDATEVELRLQGRGGHIALGRYTLDTGLGTALTGVSKRLRRAAVLRVPAGLLLERQVILPLSAELDLRRVVAHEMDRLTPFRADQVLWDCATVQRDKKRGQIHVRVTVVSRMQVQPLLDALRQSGLMPTRIETTTGLEPMRTISITGDGQKRPWAGPRALGWLQGSFALLAITAVALPFILQTVAGDRIEARIAAMRPQVTEAEGLRKLIASGTTTTDVITAARNQVGSPLQSLALLTEMLPDDTYLTQLALRQRKLSISGRSAGAARLIGALAANPLLRNPAFAAPVIRAETNGAEAFSIHVEVGS